MTKRAAEARDHLLQYGSLTTDQLKDMGYVHPPRAVGDLQDAGATIARAKVRNAAGRLIAQYTLVDQISEGRTGRVNIPKKFREALNEAHDYKCAICSGEFEGRALQADHRVPFFIGGDKAKLDQDDYMPLCGSDNMSKGQACKTCPNWEVKDEETCRTCYWAYPDNYLHVQTVPQRRVVITFQGEEADALDRFKSSAQASGVALSEAAKRKILDA
jgi:hypothetical protein